MKSIFNSDLLKDKKILITGATSGLGLESAKLFHSLGANLILTGRNYERLKKIETQFGYERCSVLNANVGNFDLAQTFAKKVIDDYAPLDGFFHSAGVGLIQPLRLMKEENYQAVFGSSIAASLGIISILSKKGAMAEDGGSILLMSSVSSIAGRQGMAIYSASKSAINGLVRSAALELSNKKIRVNALASGAIKTEMHSEILEKSSNQMMSEYEKMHPLGFGVPADIANIAAYMMSDASKWMTGAVLTIDGGYSAQ